MVLYNSDAAAKSTFFLSVLLGFLMACNILPEIPLSFLICYLNFIIFLIFWQDIKEIFMKPQLLFVDKLSIPQDDEKLKQDCIMGLGGYLRSSRKLVILWSEGEVKGGNPEPVSPRPQDSDIKMIQATWRYLYTEHPGLFRGLEGCKKMCWDAWRFATSECSRDAAGRDVRSMVAIHILRDIAQSMPSWWFQMFHVFTPTWGKDPIWLICCKWVETTN